MMKKKKVQELSNAGKIALGVTSFILAGAVVLGVVYREDIKDFFTPDYQIEEGFVEVKTPRFGVNDNVEDYSNACPELSFGYLISPISDFSAVSENADMCDWVNEFERKEITPYLNITEENGLDLYKPVQDNVIYGCLGYTFWVPIMYVNTEFVFMPYLATVHEDDTISYSYADFDYKNNAWSVAYGAWMMYTREFRDGNTCQGAEIVIDASVDTSNGMSVPVYDGSKYFLYVDPDDTVNPNWYENLYVGEEYVFNIYTESNGVKLYVDYESEDESIATVDEFGVVTPHREGKTSIFAYSGDKVFELHLNIFKGE